MSLGAGGGAWGKGAGRGGSRTRVRPGENVAQVLKWNVGGGGVSEREGVCGRDRGRGCGSAGCGCVFVCECARLPGTPRTLEWQRQPQPPPPPPPPPAPELRGFLAGRPRRPPAWSCLLSGSRCSPWRVSGRSACARVKWNTWSSGKDGPQSTVHGSQRNISWTLALSWRMRRRKRKIVHPGVGKEARSPNGCCCRKQSKAQKYLRLSRKKFLPRLEGRGQLREAFLEEPAAQEATQDPGEWDEATATATPDEQRPGKEGGDLTEGGPPWIPTHPPSEVTVTDITANSITVTFREAQAAEGFFRDRSGQL
ncbi:chromobox protein homolog 7 isoform X1 [Antechinus flavipes]|uniref:chromobox protein homolog 7 isoform X1 n=1 Tax=Antechinus flavipes TaxID=38775 RepID=UPI002236B2B8|nr:chromobox protein homolog 7 isoform X1 [Antechinus flavipes]